MTTTEDTDPLTEAEQVELDRLRARYAPKVHVTLTKAAARDLAKLQAGQPVSLCYGPYRQLLDAGLITGTQDAPVLA